MDDVLYRRPLYWPDWVRGQCMFEGARVLVIALDMPPGSGDDFFMPMSRVVGWRRMGHVLVEKEDDDGTRRLSLSAAGGISPGFGLMDCALDLADEETAARAVAMSRGDKWTARLFDWAVREARAEVSGG